MATTITPTTVTDDSGTPANPGGTGTVWNNAVLQAIWSRINAWIAGNINFGGLLGAEGFGIHPWSSGGAGGNILNIRNTTAGTGNFGAVHVGNDLDANIVRLEALSSTFTPNGPLQANGIALRGMQQGGTHITAEHASGVVRRWAGGQSAWEEWDGSRITSDGGTVGPGMMRMVLRDSINTQAVGTPSNNTETDLHTYTLPAATLDTDDVQMFEWLVHIRFAASSDDRVVRLYFGSHIVGDWSTTGAQTTPSGSIFKLTVIRTGAATQKAYASAETGRTLAQDTNLLCNTAGASSRNWVHQIGGGAQTHPTETLSGGVVVKVTGTNSGGTTNDIIAEMSYGELIG